MWAKDKARKDLTVRIDQFKPELVVCSRYGLVDDTGSSAAVSILDVIGSSAACLRRFGAIQSPKPSRVSM